MAGDVTTLIEPGLIDRMRMGIARWVVRGASDAGVWMGPGQPIQPLAQDQAFGRQLDYTVGVNTTNPPRAGEPITFTDLKALADGFDIVRLMIETRKDQIARLEWKIQPKKGKPENEKRCPEIMDFLAFPDREHDWDQWGRMLDEQMLVMDAPTICPRLTKGGQPYSFDLIDGATIKRVLDVTGRTPMPPDPAYQQILKGVPAVDYTADQLIYAPRNPRVHKIYGYSPVEQILITINIALRRQTSLLQYYTEGTIPQMLIGCPTSWQPAQVKELQNIFDSVLAGNTAQLRKMICVPGDTKPMPIKEAILKDELDDSLTRVVAFAFSVSPTALVRAVNRGTGETQKDQAMEEGLMPLMKWRKSILDKMVRIHFREPDLEFNWVEAETEIDPLIKAQIFQIALGGANGSGKAWMTPAEVREEQGLEPLSDDELEALNPKPPEPLPPPDGAVPKAPGQPIAAPPAEPSTKAGETTQKAVEVHFHNEPAPIAKAKKVIRPINRQRKSVMRLQAKMGKMVAKFLKAQVQPIAEMLHRVMPDSAEKLAKMSVDEAKAMLEALNIDWHELGDDLESVLAAIAQDGAAQGLAQIGAAATSSIVDQVNEKAVAWAEQHAADLVTKLADVTREKLRSDLAASIELGMSVKEIAAVIGPDYAFSPERAELIAQTERAFADVAGNMIAYRESGVVSKKEWALGSEHDMDDECDENADAGAIDLDEDFPSGDDAAPAHPGCICDVLPVVDEDDASEKVAKIHTRHAHKLEKLVHKMATAPAPVINVTVEAQPAPVVNLAPVNVTVEAPKAGVVTKTITLNRDAAGQLLNATTEETS